MQVGPSSDFGVSAHGPCKKPCVHRFSGHTEMLPYTVSRAYFLFWTCAQFKLYRSVAERQRELDEQKELEDFEKRQQEIREKELVERLEAEKKNIVARKPPIVTQKKNSQLKLLAGAVKRKNENDEDAQKKTKSENGTTNNSSTSKVPPVKSLLGLAAYGSDSESDSE